MPKPFEFIPPGREIYTQRGRYSLVKIDIAIVAKAMTGVMEEADQKRQWSSGQLMGEFFYITSNAQNIRRLRFLATPIAVTSAAYVDLKNGQDLDHNTGLNQLKLAMNFVEAANRFGAVTVYKDQRQKEYALTLNSMIPCA